MKITNVQFTKVKQTVKNKSNVLSMIFILIDKINFNHDAFEYTHTNI